MDNFNQNMILGIILPLYEVKWIQ